MDPQARRFLAMIAIGGPPDGARIDPSDRRRSFKKLMRFAKPPEGHVLADDARIGPRGIPVRRYTPEPDAPLMPGLVYFHGGGLVAGGLDTHDALCRTLAHLARCRVIAVDYRLAPEHPFPAAIVDALTAVRWVLRHAEDLGLRREAIAIGGDSGGATLATIVCQIMARRQVIKAQLLLCPVLDFGEPSGSRQRFASGFLLDTATMATDLSWYAPRRSLRDPRVSPLRAERLDDLPPTIIHTAGFDPLVDEGTAYACRLAEAGVSVRHHCHERLVHHFYALTGVIPAAQAALAAIGRDLEVALA